MILDWFAQAHVVVVAFIVAFLPGAITLRIVGYRGLALAALSPVMSTAITAVGALLLGFLGVRWSVLSFGVVSLVVLGLAVVVRVVTGACGSSEARVGRRRWLIPTAIAVGAGISAWRLAAYIGDPAAVSQTNDAVFHLNTIRHIAETGSASSLEVSAVIGGSGFYPAAWHGMVSLVHLATSADIAIVVNAVTLVIGAAIWTVGVAWLTRVMTGSALVAGYAAILAGTLQLFPLLMFQWGVLYPNALSTALIPAAVAAVVSIPHWHHQDRRVASWVRAALVVGIIAAALATAQPASLLIWGLLSVIWLTAYLCWVRAAAVSLRVRIATTVTAWVVLAVVWLFFSRSTSGSHWPPFRGKLEVFLDVLLNGQMRIPFEIAISVLMLLGIAVSVRIRERRWVIVGWLALSALYAIVAVAGRDSIREWVFGAWYADPYRIAALAPIIVIPLAAIGFDAVMRVVGRVLDRRADMELGGRTQSLVGLTIAAILAVLLVLLRPTAMPEVVEATFEDEPSYASTAQSFLDPDERTLLESLGDYVDEDERVIGNPSTGIAFGYTFSGLDVYPRTWAQPRSMAWEILGSELRDVERVPEVCEALAAYGDPEYVLDFGLGERVPGRYEMPGFTDFDGQDGFELVTEVGSASLWRITACAQ